MGHGARSRLVGVVVAVLALSGVLPCVARAQSSDGPPNAPVELPGAARSAPDAAPGPATPRQAARPVEPRAPTTPLKGIVKELRSGPLLMHGNYCGVGNRPGASPIDALDAACMRHDACTKTGTLPGCACNERLRREAAAIARDPRAAPDELVAAAATASAMAVLVCKSGGHLEVPILPAPR